MWEHTRTPDETEKKNDLTLTHTRTHTLSNLIGPVPDASHHLRIWFHWIGVTGWQHAQLIPAASDQGAGEGKGMWVKNTHTHTKDTLVQDRMHETDTTREGRRTSSGILHFNYSKWHFLGKTIRDGCLFPGFQLFFGLPFFTNGTQQMSCFSFVFLKAYCVPSHIPDAAIDRAETKRKAPRRLQV